MQESDFSLKEINSSDNYAEFIIEPLQPGYGYTIGNSLRRVLYTSIPGASVTAVKIAGVKHKFSTVSGLKENVIDLLLNIKNLNLRLAENKEEATLKLNVKGDKSITASDIEAPDGVEVLNKDLYLGSLTGPKSKLEMELLVKRGYEYTLAEDQKLSTIGMIPTDAIFTPVKRVSYTVEATRVGRQTNLDRLVIKIWTNGVVTPKEALMQAAKILSSSFTQIYNPKLVENEVKIEGGDKLEEVKSITIDELDLPTRIYNSLRNGGIETIGDLMQSSRKEVASLRNMGGKSINIIEDKLAEKGVSFS